MDAAERVGGAHGSRRTVPPSWSIVTRSGDPRRQATCCSRSTAAAVAPALVQAFPSNRRPPTWPAATRASNAGVGAPRSGAIVTDPLGDAAAGAAQAAAAAAARLRPSQRRNRGACEACSGLGIEVVEPGRIHREAERRAWLRCGGRNDPSGEERSRLSDQRLFLVRLPH